MNQHVAMNAVIKDVREREGGKEQRQMYTVECAECGKETQVPFEPKGDRPVYCRDCFNARRNK
mgnify:CR=1 FL=1